MGCDGTFSATRNPIPPAYSTTLALVKTCQILFLHPITPTRPPKSLVHLPLRSPATQVSSRVEELKSALSDKICYIRNLFESRERTLDDAMLSSDEVADLGCSMLRIFFSIHVLKSMITCCGIPLTWRGRSLPSSENRNSPF
jgi:hypothetical protein